MARMIDGDRLCRVLSYLKKMEYDERDEIYNSAIDDAIVEVASAPVIEPRNPISFTSIDDFINRECSISLKDGRQLSGKLTADSRYLNIVDKNTNEPFSFYGKDITHINGIPLTTEGDNLNEN